MIPVLSPEQSAEWDRLAGEAGISVAALMESAGRGAAAVLTARLPAALRQGVLVACGTGNNGGDGWVLARALHALSTPVWVAALPGKTSDLNSQVARAARQAGVREVAPDGPWPRLGLLVDAILGTGARGAPRAEAAALLARLADLHLPVVAIDGPTGLDLGDGVAHGPIPAALTLTFGGYRRGQLLARDEVGDLVVLDIGLPNPPNDWPRLFTDTAAAALVPPLSAGSHKGTRGRVVIVGGAPGMTGAARLAARSAFAAGAGLVHVMAPAESVQAIAAAEPDVQTLAQPLAVPLGTAARELLSRADALVIGPGLGREAGRRELVTAVFEASPAAVVLDADGLVAFHGAAEELARLGKSRGAALVLTPHAGEFRGLFPAEAPRLGVDPWAAAGEAARCTGATVLLKGVPTVVAGASDARSEYTVAAGNPGLATGGSGDTLSGLIAAFLAHGIAPMSAAAAGAQALGDAADLAARRVTARSARPMDVIAALPDVWRRWDLLRRAPPPPQAPILHELPAPIAV